MSASLRRYDPGYHAEPQWWTGHVTADAGILEEALISEQERQRVSVGRVPHRHRRAEIADDHSVVLVLPTRDDTADDLVRCGEVLSTVLLECTLAGYATCPLTHLTEVPQSRAAVRTLLAGSEVPQVSVRVGSTPATAEHAPQTPRRPLDEILDMPESAKHMD